MRKQSKRKIDHDIISPTPAKVTNLDKLYYKIGEVSDITGVKPYVLRYWESEFKFVNPAKTRSKQRLYKKDDVKLILEIKKLLYDEQFTISGAKKRLKELIEQQKSPQNLQLQQLNLTFESNKLSQEHSEFINSIKKELLEIKSILSSF